MDAVFAAGASLCRPAGDLAVFLALAVLAVKRTPVLKWTVALVAMMPLSMFLAASISADAVTLALAILTVALVLRLAVEPAKANLGEVLALAAVMSLLALSETGIRDARVAVLRRAAGQVRQFPGLAPGDGALSWVCPRC